MTKRLPSRGSAANTARLAISVLAHNLSRVRRA